jgi:hypothetical protein
LYYYSYYDLYEYGSGRAGKKQGEEGSPSRARPRNCSCIPGTTG